LDRTAGTGQPGQDSRTGQSEKEGQNRIARVGQAERDRQKVTCRSGLPGQTEDEMQDGQERTHTRLIEQNRQYPLS
jgi:hypothetical protein